MATRGLEARPVHQNRLYDFVTQSFSLYLVVYNGDGVGAKEPWWQYGERMTASRPLFLIGANSHRQWGWRTPRWFGDGCRRRDLLAHELSSTGLGASVPHAVLGEAIRQGCSGTPLGTGRVFSAYGRPPGTAAGCGVHRFSCSPWSSSSSRFHRCLACLVVVQCHARLGSQRSATYSAGSSRRDRGC